jgi:hypothetical protein
VLRAWPTSADLQICRSVAMAYSAPLLVSPPTPSGSGASPLPPRPRSAWTGSFCRCGSAICSSAAQISEKEGRSLGSCAQQRRTSRFIDDEARRSCVSGRSPCAPRIERHHNQHCTTLGARPRLGNATLTRDGDCGTHIDHQSWPAIATLVTRSMHCEAPPTPPRFCQGIWQAISSTRHIA